MIRVESGRPSRRDHVSCGYGVPEPRQLNRVDSPTLSFCGSLGKISIVGGSRAVGKSKFEKLNEDSRQKFEVQEKSSKFYPSTYPWLAFSTNFSVN